MALNLSLEITFNDVQTDAMQSAWQAENARRAAALPALPALTKEEFAAGLLVKVANSFAGQKADSELKDARALWLAAGTVKRANALAALRGELAPAVVETGI